MIDCDVHQNFDDVRDLVPWLDPAFRDYVLHGGYGGYSLPNYPWLHPSGFMRDDAVPPDGGVPGSSYPLLREQLLDAFDVEYAILTGEEILSVSAVPHPQLAAALATAYNRWLIEEWLPRDPRLKGSLVVAPQDPDGAAAEIRRLGGHPDLVQVLMSTGSERPYGDPFYHPIWDAAAEVGLPVAIHLGGQGGINANPTGCGPGTFFWEVHALLCETGMGHLGSVIAHGVFERWPRTKFVLIECGVAWLPAIVWRLDADYKALRKETPWLRRLPSEYAREHVRLTTQPLEQPPNVRHLWSALEAIDGEHTLLFASDYPHWDFDDPSLVPLPTEWKPRIFAENARELYGLPVREPVAGD